MARGEHIYKCLNNQAPKVLGDIMSPLRFCGSVNYFGCIDGELQSAYL